MSASEMRRVAVSNPRTRAPRVSHRWPVVRDIDEQTELGAVYLRSLMRAQLRLAIVSCAVVVAIGAGLPMVFVLAPGLSDVRLAGVRLPWLVLGGCVQPIWIAVGWWHIRQAERNERAFTDLVERS